MGDTLQVGIFIADGKVEKQLPVSLRKLFGHIGSLEVWFKYHSEKCFVSVLNIPCCKIYLEDRCSSGKLEKTFFLYRSRTNNTSDESCILAVAVAILLAMKQQVLNTQFAPIMFIANGTISVFQQ